MSLRSRLSVGRTARSSTRPLVRTASGALLGLALAAGTCVAAQPAQAAGPTIVSITFDNQWANQMTAAASLKRHGMAGTFYVISGWIGLPGFMTLNDLRQLAADGNEIGGKTVNNPKLPTLSDAEAMREICQGRNVLASYGFQVTNFAYPHAEYNAATEQAARACGFATARGVGDLVENVPDGCTAPDCPYAESIPPADPFAIRTPSDGEVSTTLAELQYPVTNAVANGGGLLAFSFHQICETSTPGCDPTYSVTPAFFDSFLDWLATQQANGVQVKTVQQALGGAVNPQVVAPTVPAAAVGVNALVNPALTTADPNAPSQAQCWTPASYGTNSPTFTWSATGGHGGGGQNTIVMSGLSSGDAKLVTNFDLGQCAPTTTAGHAYRLQTWYKSSVPVNFTVYQRSTLGTWAYLTGSPSFPPAADWTLASWLTPTIPATVGALSYGMTITRNGTLSTSDYSLTDVGAGLPPAAAVGVNALANPLLQTSDGSGTAPSCWTGAGWGSNNPTYSWTPTGGHNGGQETITMTGWVNGDAKLIPSFDNGNCAPTVTPGVRYRISLYYKSTVPVFITLYGRDANGNWSYWTQSPTVAAAGDWTQATWTTPVVPGTTTGMSFGMTLAGNGTLSTSDYSLVNTGSA
jgi:hypothetical protein